MEIKEQTKERSITDYDFMFTAGAKLGFAVDEEAGDTCKDTPDHYEVNLIAKPSMLDPTIMSDPTNVKILKVGLAAIAVTQRKIRVPTEEEIFERKNTILKALEGSDTVQ